MEQGGESLRKRGFMSEDRIGELPEALLLEILSSLPTKTVIATSVLSKRWKSLWKMVPKLEFESYGNITKFAEDVTRSLLSHKAPVLESLQLKVSDTCDGVYIGIWTTIAFTRHVREFVLDLNFPNMPPVRLPCSLFCFDTIETLKLKGCILLDVPSSVSMKSLRTLHLQSVVYGGEVSVHSLLSSCPNLEHLVVHLAYSYYSSVVNFINKAPSLNALPNGGYVINAPSLKYLKIKGLKGYQLRLIENASEFVEASILLQFILGYLKLVKRISLDISTLKITYPTEVIFHQLVYLEMYTHKGEWWNLLTFMLDSSPKLQVLKLIDEQKREFGQNYRDTGKWNQPKYVPECLESHLETFVWTRYDWRKEEENEVATYILRNARQLKKAIFSTNPIESKKLNKKRRKKLNELDGVVRASNLCHLVIES